MVDLFPKGITASAAGRSRMARRPASSGGHGIGVVTVMGKNPSWKAVQKQFRVKRRQISKREFALY